MIVDNSMVARAVLSRMIEADGGFRDRRRRRHRRRRHRRLGQVRVDIILLDLEMPGAGGLKSIPRILEAAQGAKVMIVSSLAEEGAEETVAALALGAADTLPKPGTGRFNGRFSEDFAEQAARARPCRPQPTAPSAVAPRAGPHRAAARQSDEPLRLVAIGASTGGIHALGSFFQALPEPASACRSSSPSICRRRS